MKLPNKIFAHAGGGLGDIYYLCTMHDWALFKDIKRRNPKAKIHAVLSSPNPLSAEVVQHNPYIDKLEFINPKDRKEIALTEFMQPGYTYLSHVRKKFNLRKDSTIYTNEDDKKQLREVKAKTGDNYIVIHPFSSDVLKKAEKGKRESRYVFPLEEYFDLVDRLTEMGYKVVVFGGNARTKRFREDFPHENPDVINLIDKLNARTAAIILSEASGFIGTYSCFIGVAWWHRVRSVLLAPDAIWRGEETWKQRIETWPRWAWATKEPQNKILYLPRLAESSEQKFEKARDEIAKWFDNERDG